MLLSHFLANDLRWHKIVGSVLQRSQQTGFGHSSKMWSTHHLLLRSGLWWTLSKRERERERENKNIDTDRTFTFHLADLNWKEPHRFFFQLLIKSRLANTSRDSFKFCQLLGKSGRARFTQHDLLHKGMEQGELPVPPTELGELWMEKTRSE